MEQDTPESPTPTTPSLSSDADPVLVERRDRALRGKTFKSWLRDHAEDPRFTELDDVVNGHPDFRGVAFLKMDFDKWSNQLLAIDKGELIEPLLHATTEWQADALARNMGKGHLGIKNALVAGEKLPRTRSLTPEMPIPLVDCGWKNRRGIQCSEPAIPGALRCAKHGGNWLDPVIRQRLLLAAYMRLVEGAEIAVEALLDVVENGKREDARVMAAREILDRAGIRGGVDVNIVLPEGDGVGQSDQILQLRERLDTMAESLQARDQIEEDQRLAREALIIEAEVIEEIVVEEVIIEVEETVDAEPG